MEFEMKAERQNSSSPSIVSDSQHLLHMNNPTKHQAEQPMTKANLNFMNWMSAKHVLFGIVTTVSLAACGGNQPQTTTTVVTGGSAQYEINALAAPAPLTNPNVSSVTPAHGSTTASPTSSITITFIQAPVKAVIEKAFSLTPGMYNTNPAQKLTLTSMCAGQWRVRNPNINDLVVFTWDVYKTTQVGSGIVPGGADVYFQTAGGTETARVFVNGVQNSLKANNPTVCTGSTPSDVPGAITGTKTWSIDGKTLTFQPTPPANSSNTALNPGASYSVFLGLDKAQATTFTVGQQFKMLSVGTTNFKNDVTTDVTINGAGFNAHTAFFLQSNKLEVISISDLKAVVRIPSGFLPSVYGLMAANPDGGRTTLYPAFTITAGAEPKAIDPKGTQYRSFVEGYVTDYTNGQPVSGATVGIPGLKTTTTSAGYYLLRGVPQGRQAIRIEADGYEPAYRIAEVNGVAQTLTMKTATLEPFDTNSTLIGPAGGTHNASNGAFLKIPPGALDKDVEIQFTHLRAAATLPELPKDGSYLAFAHLGPTGLVFKKPATLYLPLQPGIVIQVGQRINIFYYDSRQAKWVDDITSGVISNINGKLFLEYEINHFTWIGGSWFDDTVRGCVVHSNGTPAVGWATNYGVTDEAGKFSGTVTQSAIGRTLPFDISGLVHILSKPTVVYAGNGSVDLPCAVIADANDPGTQPPATPENPGDDNPGDPCGENSISTLSFEQRSLAFKPKNILSKLEVPTSQLVLAQNVSALSVPLYGFSERHIKADTIKFMIDGVDVTYKMTLEPAANVTDAMIARVKLFEPLRAKANVEITLTGSTREGQAIESKQNLAVAAGIDTQPVDIYYRPDDRFPADVLTPYVEMDNSGIEQENTFTDIHARNSNAGQLITVNVQLRTIDESGKTIAMSPETQLGLSDLTQYAGLKNAGSAKIVEGYSRVPITITIPAAPPFDATQDSLLEANRVRLSNTVIGSQLKAKSIIVVPCQPKTRQVIIIRGRKALFAPSDFGQPFDVALPQLPEVIPCGILGLTDAKLRECIAITRKAAWDQLCSNIPALDSRPFIVNPTYSFPQSDTEISARLSNRQQIVQYGRLDTKLRPTCVRSMVTKSGNQGTEPSVDPTGWADIKKSTINIYGSDDPLRRDRGHLLGAQLGGLGSVKENLIPQFRYANSPCQKRIEDWAAGVVYATRAFEPLFLGIFNLDFKDREGYVLYSAQPTYVRRTPSDRLGSQLIPEETILTIIAFDGVSVIEDYPGHAKVLVHLVRKVVDVYNLIGESGSKPMIPGQQGNGRDCELILHEEITHS
jgi:hypothetical protein